MLHVQQADQGISMHQVPTFCCVHHRHAVYLYRLKMGILEIKWMHFENVLSTAVLN